MELQTQVEELVSENKALKLEIQSLKEKETQQNEDLKQELEKSKSVIKALEEVESLRNTLPEKESQNGNNISSMYHYSQQSPTEYVPASKVSRRLDFDAIAKDEMKNSVVDDAVILSEATVGEVDDATLNQSGPNILHLDQSEDVDLMMPVYESLSFPIHEEVTRNQDIRLRPPLEAAKAAKHREKKKPWR